MSSSVLSVSPAAMEMVRAGSAPRASTANVFLRIASAALTALIAAVRAILRSARPLFFRVSSTTHTAEKKSPKQDKEVASSPPEPPKQDKEVASSPPEPPPLEPTAKAEPYPEVARIQSMEKGFVACIKENPLTTATVLAGSVAVVTLYYNSQSIFYFKDAIAGLFAENQQAPPPSAQHTGAVIGPLEVVQRTLSDNFSTVLPDKSLMLITSGSVLSSLVENCKTGSWLLTGVQNESALVEPIGEQRLDPFSILVRESREKYLLPKVRSSEAGPTRVQEQTCPKEPLDTLFKENKGGYPLPKEQGGVSLLRAESSVENALGSIQEKLGALAERTISLIRNYDWGTFLKNVGQNSISALSFCYQVTDFVVRNVLLEWRAWLAGSPFLAYWVAKKIALWITGKIVRLWTSIKQFMMSWTAVKETVIRSWTWIVEIAQKAYVLAKKRAEVAWSTLKAGFASSLSGAQHYWHLFRGKTVDVWSSIKVIPSYSFPKIRYPSGFDLPPFFVQ